MTIGIASNMPKACPYINAGGRAYSLILDSYCALGIELNITDHEPCCRAIRSYENQTNALNLAYSCSRRQINESNGSCSPYIIESFITS